MDFFGVVEWGFCWVFCENVVQIVVFCGQLVEQSVANVDSGCAILAVENRHFRQLYLSTGLERKECPLCEQPLAVERHLRQKQ